MRNVISNKDQTIDAIIALVQTRNQWTNYMENVLELVTLKLSTDEGSQDDIVHPLPSLRTASFPF